MESNKKTPESPVVDPDRIVGELDKPLTGEQYRPLIRVAQAHGERIVPDLIQAIERATAQTRAGAPPEGNAHFLALFLLAEFEAKEALPAIVESISLPGEGPFDLYGDAVTEILSRVLAALVGDSLETLDRLIENRNVNHYVRWEAAKTYHHLFRDGVVTRDVAVERLRAHLRHAIDELDAPAAGMLVSELDPFAPREALAEIEEAFWLGLVDPLMISLDEVRQDISKGAAWIQKALSYCPPTGITDTVKELERYGLLEETED